MIKYKKNLLNIITDATILELINALTILNKNQKENFFKEYTLIDDKELRCKLSNSEKAKNNYYLKKIEEEIKIRRRHETIEKPNKEQDFWRLFYPSKKEDILLAISCLPTNERILLYKQYGHDLSNTKINKKLTNKELYIVKYCIIKKLKRILKKVESGNYVIEGIQDQFEENITFEQIKKAVNQSTEDYRRICYYYFDKDLEKKAIVPKHKSKKILKSLIMENLHKTIFNKTITKEFFNPFVSQFYSQRIADETDKELLERVKSYFYVLKEEELDIIYRKYDKNLENTTNKGNFTKEENKILLRLIIPKLINNMKKSKKDIIYCMPLKDFFAPLIPFEEALIEITTLKYYEIKLLKQKYNEDYSGITPKLLLSKEENYIIKKAINKIQKRLIKRLSIKTGLSEKILYKIKRLFKSEEVNTLKNIYSENYAHAIIIKKYMFNEVFNEQISILTNVNTNMIILLTKNYLLKEKELLCNEDENINIKSLTK